MLHFRCFQTLNENQSFLETDQILLHMIQAGIVLFFLLNCCCAFTADAQDKGSMTIEIVGLRNNKGTVRVGIYNKEEAYLKDAGVIKKLSCTIKDSICLIESGTLPFGDYALALLHDENDNGAMDYNFIRIPKEGFGFSNNPSIRLGAPSFSESKVKLTMPEQKITIRAKYM